MSTLGQKRGQWQRQQAKYYQRTHQIEEVSARLRAMMPWIGAKKLVDKEKN